MGKVADGCGVSVTGIKTGVSAAVAVGGSVVFVDVAVDVDVDVDVDVGVPVGVAVSVGAGVSVGVTVGVGVGGLSIITCTLASKPPPDWSNTTKRIVYSPFSCLVVFHRPNKPPSTKSVCGSPIGANAWGVKPTPYSN